MLDRQAKDSPYMPLKDDAHYGRTSLSTENAEKDERFACLSISPN